jgi:cytochrome c1
MIQKTLRAVAAASVLFSLSAIAAPAPKTYQVTGPVLEVTETTVTVQKGEEKWTVQRTKKTKITGDLKVGAKVTIYYQMIADEVEVKK